ncbi:MAG: TrkH family potassium uptake protein [Lachnospiraceae bacterium]|nr:TrkH family potassium uptake protein [Lachnospiraceae bacterium]
MNKKMVLYFIGWILRIEAICMILPIITAIIYREDQIREFLVTALICLGVGIFLSMKKPTDHAFYTREGFVSVGLGWIVLSMTGALPFVLDGCIPSYVDALFEVVSGFTTTGATILNDVEVLPRSMLMWRSFTHWLGGMGILMFILALLPVAGQNNMHIVRAESPGPTAGKFVARARDSAAILYIIYIAITVTEAILLIIGKMPVYDAILITFGTVGTGGFGMLNDSCGSYTVYQQTVITIFMLLCGTNFYLYFLLLTKKFKDAFSLEEVKTYFAIVFASSILITINVLDKFDGVVEAFRHSIFQVASIITTTGYSTVDFDLWPTFSKTILVLIMFCGACAGSTGGGIKVSRIIICVKTVGKEFTTMIHPRNVKVLKFEGKAIDHDVLRSVNTYIMTYIAVFAGSLLIVSLDNFDFQSTFTAITATINNIGPGIGAVGPMANYSGFSDLSKIVMSFDMLAGRLELFPILLLFSARTWKKSM